MITENKIMNRTGAQNYKALVGMYNDRGDDAYSTNTKVGTNRSQKFTF